MAEQLDLQRRFVSSQTVVESLERSELQLHGEKGSAKSTLQTLIKILVDPAQPTQLTIHNDREDKDNQALGLSFILAESSCGFDISRNC